MLHFGSQCFVFSILLASYASTIKEIHIFAKYFFLIFFNLYRKTWHSLCSGISCTSNVNRCKALHWLGDTIGDLATKFNTKSELRNSSSISKLHNQIMLILFQKLLPFSLPIGSFINISFTSFKHDIFLEGKEAWGYISKPWSFSYFHCS